MSDLIDREALLRQIDIDSEGEPGYYGDTWKFIDTIKRMPSALGTNLAEVGTDAISRQQAIDDIWTVSPLARLDRKWVDRWLRQLPSAQPEPSQVAMDIARIVENEKDMRILPKKGHWIIYTVSPFDGEDVKCSECGQRGCATYWDYCPNCGSYNGGEEVADG